MSERILMWFCIMTAFMIIFLCIMFLHEAGRMQREYTPQMTQADRNRELSRRRLEKIQRINRGL